MNNTLKDLLKSTVISIGMSLTIFSLVCIVFDIGFGGNFSLEDYRMTKMIIGCVIYTLVAYAVGWIGGSASIGQGIVIAAIQLAAAFIIWFCFMRFYRSEAKKMNDKIQQMK